MGQRLLGRLDACLETLTDLLEVDSENKAALQMQQEVDREWKRQCATQKQRLKKLWKKSFALTTIFAARAFAEQDIQVVPREKEKFTVFILGASSGCELVQLDPVEFLKRLPDVKELNIVLIGFLGQLDPENKLEPDQQRPEQQGVLYESEFEGRKAITRAYYGKYQDLAKEGGQLESEDLVPDFVVVPQPQLHRYFHDWFEAIEVLVRRKIPTAWVGASKPDPAWEQDEIFLKELGCTLCVRKIPNPYPMVSPADTSVRKNNHVIGFTGGSPSPSRSAQISRSTSWRRTTRSWEASCKNWATPQVQKVSVFASIRSSGVRLHPGIVY